MVLAHGIGTRADLPVPTALAAIGAGLVLVISFAALAVLWRRPRFSGGDAGRPLPAALQRLLDASVLRILLQAAALAAVVTVCVVGLAGPDSTVLNLAPWIFYITFWVGIVPASLLLGPVWRVLNPLRLLHTIIARALRLDRERGMIVLPDRLGYWPATVSIAVFAWFELVYPGRAEPAAVVTFVLCYGAVNVVAALLVGRRWFERGDGFEVYSVLLAAMAPVGRRTDGTLVVRNPFQGLGALHTAPGLVGFVVVLVGSTAYDGLSRTSYWQANVPAGTANATLALACSVLLIGVLYLLGTWSLIAPGERDQDGASPAAFAHSIVPIAAGYAIAHYFSLLVIDGQQTVILASDPFGTGADLFGTAGRVIDYTVVGTATIAVVQVGGIVIGHLVAAVSAHDRAIQLFPTSAARTVQYPLLAAMVALTMGAVGLVFAA